MRKQNKKGFTIVELVIVIAVIAILVAVMVPTFVTLVRKAQISNDRQLVKNLNTALQTESQSDKAPATMQGALDIAAEYGYDVAKINAKASDNEILWDSVNNVYCYFDKDGGIEYIPEAPKAKDTTPVDYWVIDTEVSDKYSTYYTGTETTITTSKGFDAGTSGVTSVTYATTAAQTVTIRTNSPYAILTIDAKNSTVKHYDEAAAVNIIAVAGASYHENGSVAKLNAKEGRVVVEKDAVVGTLAVVNTADVKLDNQGVVFATATVVYDATQADSDEYSSGFAVATTTATLEGVTPTTNADVIKVGTADALINLALIQSQGVINDLKIELTANIDLTGKAWVPFGSSYDYSFSGSIDGKGFKIIGLSNKYTDPDRLAKFEPTTGDNKGVTGEIFGLIAVACAKDDQVLTIKNLTMENVDIAGSELKGAAALVGVFGDYKSTKAAKNVKATFENVKVTGALSGLDKIAGFIGGASHNGNQNMNNSIQGHVITFTNCTNEANITADSHLYTDANNKQSHARAAGFVGQFGDRQNDDEHTTASSITFSGCKNSGNITAIAPVGDRSYWAGEFIGHLNLAPSGNTMVTCTIGEDCVNSGTVEGYKMDQSGNKQ